MGKIKSFFYNLTSKQYFYVIPFFLVLIMFGGLNFYFGYWFNENLKKQKVVKDQLYTIKDSNGITYTSKCNGYLVINADTIELCEGFRIKYNCNPIKKLK